MKIHVVGAVGQGPTTLSAFDEALLKTRVANYNLIRLSSVIPPHAEVVETDNLPQLPGEWGDRLYAVYAEMRTNVRGNQAWAGVGWVTEPDTGKGLFVEHEGHSEEEVRTDITNTLSRMVKNRQMGDLQIRMKVVGGTCEEEPICALVVAAYQVTDWENRPYLQ